MICFAPWNRVAPSGIFPLWTRNNTEVVREKITLSNRSPISK